ncbi:MAG: hypothetical protein U5L45_09710 [Saprospiraceae bacterium]|nr:hypothetical protein [Saprospiraceae bacterium]
MVYFSGFARKINYLFSFFARAKLTPLINLRIIMINNEFTEVFLQPSVIMRQKYN